MEILSLLVVLVACWSTGNVAWSLFAGGRRALLQVLPSAVSAALATAVILFSSFAGDTTSPAYRVLSGLTLALFVFSDLLPKWVRSQVNLALNAGSFERAIRVAGWAHRLPHPVLRLEALRVRVLAELKGGDVEAALEDQRALIGALFGIRRLEAIANLLAVLSNQRDWKRFLSAYEEYGGQELLEEVPSLGQTVLQAQGSEGNLGGVCRTLQALEEGYVRNPSPQIWEMRALGLTLLGEPEALATVLERSGTQPDQALALRQLAAVRSGALPAEGAGLSLPPELLVQPARTAEVAEACRGAVERVLAASALPPPVPAFPTHRPRWGEVPLTSGLLAALVAVFLAVESSGSSVDTWTLVSFGACVKWTALSSEPWRLLTATLLHAGLLHLAVNGYALHVLGRLAEPVFGTSRLAGIYLLSALGGSLGSVAWGLSFNPTGTRGMVSVGASGAIMGLLGALLVAVLLLRSRLPQGLRRRLLVGLSLPLALQVFMVIGVPNVDHAAHLGGLFAGGLSALVLRPRALQADRSWDKGWLILLCGLYAVAAGLGSGFDAEAFYDRLPQREIALPNTELTVKVPVAWRTTSELGELGEGDPEWGALYDPLMELRLAVLQHDPNTPDPADLATFLTDESGQWDGVRRVVVTAEPTQAEDGWWEVELRVDALSAEHPSLSLQLACFGALEVESQTLIVGIVPSKREGVARTQLRKLRAGLESAGR